MSVILTGFNGTIPGLKFVSLGILLNKRARVAN